MNTIEATVELDSSFYDTQNDLAAAANDYATLHGLEGYNLEPRWGDEERLTILLTVPAKVVEISGLSLSDDHTELERAAADYAKDHPLPKGWDLNARWRDAATKNTILLTVPVSL